jgi:regulator of sigma E protease
MISIIIFLLVLSVLVLAHELGHFLAAKRSRVKVEEFALGFPPTVYTYTKGETKYMYNLIPFGGYVKMYGEDGTHAKDKKSFTAKNWLTKVFIVSAGVIMNLILGALLLSIVFMLGMPVMTDNVERDYPYAQKETETLIYQIPEGHLLSDSISAGDKIVAVNDQPITSIDSFKEKLQLIGEQPYQITLNHDSETKTISATSELNPDTKQWQLGVDLIEGFIVKYPFYLALPMGIVEMLRLLWLMISSLFMIVYNLIVSQSVPSEIAGPVGIYKLTSQASAMGIVYLLQMMAILSVNLALINFLPIPALDGGRIVFIISERIFGKKMSAATENIIHMIGFFAIVAILIIVTIGDVRKFF